MAEETNKRVSAACAVSFKLHKTSFFVISGGSLWFKWKLTIRKITKKGGEKKLLTGNCLSSIAYLSL